MRPGPARTLVASLALIVPVGLGGCDLQAAMTTCASCGEVRSIAPRALRHQIRLPTAAPQVITLAGDAATPVVYDVRVRMDRGGSRDFVVSEARHLSVGDRVEVVEGQLVPVLAHPGPVPADWS